MTTTPLMFRLEATTVHPDRDDIGALEARFANFFGGTPQAMRCISRTRRISFAPLRQQLRSQQRPLDDLRPLIAALESAQAGTDGADVPRLVRERRDTLDRLAPAAQAVWQRLAVGEADAATISAALAACAGVFWRARWLANYRTMYEVLEREEPMFALDHHCLIWPEGRTHAESLRATLQSTFLLPGIVQAPLPSLIPGRYQEGAHCLIPAEDGLPFLRVLTAYDIRDWWDFWSWHELLFGQHEVALAIDVRTIPRGTATRALTNAYKTLDIAVHGHHAEKDTRSEDALADVQDAMRALTSHNLHEVGMALLIQAPTLAALDDQTQQCVDSFGARLKLDVLRGSQADHLKLFTPTPAKAIGAPLVRRNAMSIHLAATLPWALGKANRQRGISWGYDPFEQLLVLHDLFGITGTDNPHGLILGKAGSGKTVLFNLLGLRHAVIGHQVVFFDPVGKCRWLAEAAGYGGVCYDVATTMSLNILDPLETDYPRQLSQVVTKLTLVLGRATKAGSGVRYDPRILTNRELTALDAALQADQVYGPQGCYLAQMDATTGPLLGDLVLALREVRTPTATDLAEEIAGVALQARAATFGQRTSLRWDFSADVTCYNLQRADPMLLPLLLDHGLASLDAYVRSPSRLASGRGLIGMFDEFGVLSQIDALREEVAFKTKEYRNYKAGVFTGDQNAWTYIGGTGGAELFQAYTANNTAVKLIGRQEGSDIALLAEAYGTWLGPRELQAIRTAGPGEFVGIFGNEVHHLRIQPTDAEWPFFIRSA